MIVARTQRARTRRALRLVVKPMVLGGERFATEVLTEPVASAVRVLDREAVVRDVDLLADLDVLVADVAGVERLALGGGGVGGVLLRGGLHVKHITSVAVHCQAEMCKVVRMTIDPPTYSVYVIESADGEPIYVGVTGRSHARHAEHMATKAWAAETHATRWEHFATRAEAEKRESELIRLHEPRYNIAGNPGARVVVDSSIREDLESRLASLGRRRERARKTLAEVSGAIPIVAKEARAAGLSKVEIARLASISRPALDEMLSR